MKKAWVVVDSREDCQKNTGEVSRSGLSKEQIVEVSETLDLASRLDSKLRNGGVECLEDDLVVYKSVGVSLTDLAAGQMLLKLALKGKVGMLVPDF